MGLNEFHKHSRPRFDGYLVYYNELRVGAISHIKDCFCFQPLDNAFAFSEKELEVICKFLKKLGTFKKSYKSPSTRDMWDHSVGG